MTLHKHFALFALGLSLTTACQQAPEEDTAGLQQKVGPFISPNGKTPYYQSTLIGQTPIRGLRNSRGWKLMDKNSESAASIDTITYGNQPVTSLSSSQGWFYVSTQNLSNVQVDGSIELKIHVTAPFNGSISIKKSSLLDPNSGERYVGTFLPDSGGSQLMCPELLYPATETQPAQYHNHPLIQIANLKWNIETGARTSDTSAITLACGQDPLGACVQWGYAPWDTYTPNCLPGQLCFPASLTNHHQACARMKRADFCGDGVSLTWTPDPNIQFKNVFIHMWDSAGLNPMTPQTRYTMEANWGPSGAGCINMSELRVSTMTDGQGHTFDAATSCGTPIPACSSTTPGWYMGSARPCTETNLFTGNCIAN